jgi:hypothetical protein
MSSITNTPDISTLSFDEWLKIDTRAWRAARRLRRQALLDGFSDILHRADRAGYPSSWSRAETIIKYLIKRLAKVETDRPVSEWDDELSSLDGDPFTIEHREIIAAEAVELIDRLNPSTAETKKALREAARPFHDAYQRAVWGQK